MKAMIIALVAAILLGTGIAHALKSCAHVVKAANTYNQRLEASDDVR